MRLLLDTHILLWSLTNPDRLSANALTLVRDRSSGLVVSAASAWEVATKHRLGKLPGAQGLVAAFDHNLVRLGATELPVSARHALVGGGLAWEHRDPFDRILAAQAVIEDLVLVTADAVFAEVAGLRTLW